MGDGVIPFYLRFAITSPSIFYEWVNVWFCGDDWIWIGVLGDLLDSVALVVAGSFPCDTGLGGVYFFGAVVVGFGIGVLGLELGWFGDIAFRSSCRVMLVRVVMAAISVSLPSSWIFW